VDFKHLTPVSWYPGHMLKAEREIRERLGMVDVVIELLDARCPASSRNFRLEESYQHKTRLLILGKTDLAEASVTKVWVQHFRDQDLSCLTLHHTQGDLVSRVMRELQIAEAAGRRRRGATVPRLRALRVMVLGLPNVGKSSLINALVKRSPTKTGPTPGLTRHQQWVKLNEDVELLDTPGIMAPKVAEVEAGLRLGLIAAVKDDLIGDEILADYLHHLCQQTPRPRVLQTYDLPELPDSGEALLDQIATRRGLVQGGGVLDRHGAAGLLLRDFRAGTFGRWSLDPRPEPSPA
jgi:ribosome biogenesis GTPase A